jgi:hypothetical protein
LEHRKKKLVTPAGKETVPAKQMGLLNYQLKNLTWQRNVFCSAGIMLLVVATVLYKAYRITVKKKSF